MLRSGFLECGGILERHAVTLKIEVPLKCLCLSTR